MSHKYNVLHRCLVGSLSILSHFAYAETTYTTITMTAPKGMITAELADTEEKQEKGLMDKTLDENQGMLFTYNYSQAANLSFSMRNIDFPIDMVWINANKEVTYVHSNISPDTYKKTESVVYFPPEPVPYLLTLPAHSAEQLGISKGTLLAFNLSGSDLPIEPHNYASRTLHTPKGDVKMLIPKTALYFDRGLSNRKSFSPGLGMLFVFDKPSYNPMWMKDMYFPIDIVWVDANGTVVYIKENANPSRHDKMQAMAYYAPEPNSEFVIELPAGDTTRLGITIGTKLYIN